VFRATKEIESGLTSSRESQTLREEGAESGGAFQGKMAELPKDDPKASSAFCLELLRPSGEGVCHQTREFTMGPGRDS
jgi:hypothetical protein